MIESIEGLSVKNEAISEENLIKLSSWLDKNECIPWEQAIEGRRVAQWGVRYDYSKQCVDLTPVASIPDELRQWLPEVTSEFT